MKILIMVLSYMKPPFDKMYYAQKETWDSVEHENIKTVYYFGGDKYRLMHVPFREALKEHWDEDWDVIFRTNSSSYIDKKRLYEHVKDRSTTNLWIGNPFGFASGSGVFISRDLAEILKDNITDEQYRAEDLLLSDILKAKGYVTERGKRVSYNHNTKTYVPCYHIRCKDESNPDPFFKYDRYQDVLAMYHIFSTLDK